MTSDMITILQGDWIERLRTLLKASVHCCVTSPPSNANSVQFFSPEIKAFHRFTKIRSARCRPNMPAPFGDSCPLAPLLYHSQFKSIIALLLLHPEKREYGGNTCHCPPICGRPRNEWFSPLGVWLRQVERSTKSFFEEFRDSRGHLTQRDTLRISWLFRVASYAHGICTALYSDSTVRVNSTSKIAEQFSFSHL